MDEKSYDRMTRKSAIMRCGNKKERTEGSLRDKGGSVPGIKETGRKREEGRRENKDIKER